MSIQTIASIFWFSFSKKRSITADDIRPGKMKLFREMHSILLKKGIYLGPSGYEVGFISAAHDKETLAYAAKIINKAIDKVMK
jgi:glutamate-1-semialdehyde 2,1-aminomutase